MSLLLVLLISLGLAPSAAPDNTVGGGPVSVVQPANTVGGGPVGATPPQPNTVGGGPV
ncbi:MAG: hypothetical protein JWM87_1607 [Candidatus Eremiobacteraeota bacterium]|nr:hypothetical protein [Candidatus Eremiobacteraeota bacterium]